MLTCEVCKRPMAARRSTKRFCSAQCRTAHYRRSDVTLSASEGQGTGPDSPSALTSGNVKSPNALTSGNANAKLSASAAKLVKHVERHYTRFQLENDLDCVLSCCRTSAEWDAVADAARAKISQMKIRTRIRWPRKPGFTEPDHSFAIAVTARNVSLGLQGRCDLDRYAAAV